MQKPLILATLPLLLSLSPIKSTALSEKSQLSTNALGPVKVGMTVKEASQQAGIQLIQRPSGGEPHCYYYKAKTGLSGVDFMVTQGRISRIDIKNPKITTLSGAKVGDSEAQIKSLYPNQIDVQNHKYVQNGHYLIFMPKDTQDKQYRLIFETDGKKVTLMRSGKLPEILWVEGCL
jgi:hypothetical protein